MIELRKLIVKDIKILEVGQTTEYGDSLMTATFFTRAESRQQPHYDHKQTKGTILAFLFCDGTHHSNECTQVQDPTDSYVLIALDLISQ